MFKIFCLTVLLFCISSDVIGLKFLIENENIELVEVENDTDCEEETLESEKKLTFDYNLHQQFRIQKNKQVVFIDNTIYTYTTDLKVFTPPPELI